MSASTRSLTASKPLPDAQPSKNQLVSGVAIGAGAGLIAALFASLASHGWYPSLVKPMWALTSSAMGTIQILVGLCTGAALAFVLASRMVTARKRVVLSWFWAQLILGLVWNGCFFGLQSLAWGYAVVMVWWCAVVALIWTGSKTARAAFWLLVPLFAWVTFASSLNFSLLSFNVLRQKLAIMDADPRNANTAMDPPIIVRKR